MMSSIVGNNAINNLHDWEGKHTTYKHCDLGDGLPFIFCYKWNITSQPATCVETCVGLTCVGFLLVRDRSFISLESSSVRWPYIW